MRTARLGQVCLWFMLVAGLLANCSPKSTPPGANSVGGSVDGVVLYSYHYWEEGLAILIWHDFSYGESGCRGSGSTEDPVYRLVCDVEARDGRRFNWEVHTGDGVTAQMWINGESYDLAHGAMFLVAHRMARPRLCSYNAIYHSCILTISLFYPWLAVTAMSPTSSKVSKRRN